MQYQENVTIEQKSHTPEAVVWRCSVTKVFLKFYKIHKKTPVSEFFCQQPEACNFIERDSGTGIFL